MDEQAKSILELMDEMRLFYKDVSLLLKTIDDLMDEKKWPVPEKVGGSVVARTSGHIDYYPQWFPNILYHYYMNSSYPNIVAFCSVLIGDDRDKDYELNDVLITAGFFEFEDGTGIESFTPWWSSFYALMIGNKKISQKSKKRTFNGINVLSTNTSDWTKEISWAKYCDFKSVTAFALPLFQITNSAEVESKIVKPLLELILSENKMK